MKKLFIFISFALLLTTKSNAQKKIIYQHEYGGNLGISNFQGDFRPKGPFDGKATINGFALDASHYLHILPSRSTSAIYRHLILKSSLEVNITSYNNDGYPTTTDNDKKLAKLTSTATLISFDNELQFYFKDVIEYLHQRSKSKTSPYIAIGLGVNYINAKTNEDSIDIPENYKDSNTFDGGSPIAISGNLAFGARYKASQNYDLIAQLRVKYYLSDSVDGVNPDIAANKINDFNSVISVGFIYHMF